VLKTLCDTDEQFFDSRSKIVIEKTGMKPLTEWDIHKVLDDKEINAVSVVYQIIGMHWLPSGLVRQVNMFMLKNRLHIIFGKDGK